METCHKGVTMRNFIFAMMLLALVGCDSYFFKGDRDQISQPRAEYGEKKEPVQPIPEPATLALFGLGIGLSMLARRKCQKMSPRGKERLF